jgi:hypothetical protein
MNDLVSWLLEQIALQEARAQGDIEHFGDSSEPRDQWIEKMARQFLAECEAKRRIVNTVAPICACIGPRDGSDKCPCAQRLDEMGWLLRDLAEPYADRPGYREEWRP